MERPPKQRLLFSRNMKRKDREILNAKVKNFQKQLIALFGVDIELTCKVIRHDRRRKTDTDYSEIIKAVFQAINTVTKATEWDLKSDQKSAVICDIRAIAIHMVRVNTQMTGEQIAGLFNRVHSGITLYCNKYRDLYKYDMDFRETARQVQDEFKRITNQPCKQN